MRPNQSASAIVALLATAASAMSPARLHCLRSRNAELARLSVCGEAGSVAHCLDMIPDDFSQADLEACYINAGCERTEALVESQWALDRCEETGEIVVELRNRHMPMLPRQTTAADRTQDATDTATATGTSAAGASTRVCSTTTTKSTTLCPVHSTGPSAGRTILDGCFPTTVAFATCAAGMLCKDDRSGKPSCLLIDNSLDGAGIAVAIFFAVTITGAIAAITFLCCRERRDKKRIMARAEAAAIAKESAMGVKRPTANVQAFNQEGHASQPLISQGNQAAEYDAHDPFGDRNRA